MLIQHLTEKQCRGIIDEAAWRSPVQLASSCGIKLTCDENTLLFVSKCQGTVATISFALSSYDANNSWMIRKAIDHFLMQNTNVAELVTYLTDESELPLLDNGVYRFEKIGMIPEGLQDSRGQRYDLYVFGCPVETKIPLLFQGLPFDCLTFPVVLDKILPTRYGNSSAITFIDNAKRLSISYSMLPHVIAELERRLNLQSSQGEIVALTGDGNPFWLLSCLAILHSGNTLLPVESIGDTPNQRVPFKKAFTSDLQGNDCALPPDKAIPSLPVYTETIAAIDLATSCKENRKPTVAKPECIAIIAETSGTYGYGKPTLITHANITASLAHAMLTIDKFVSPGKEVVFPCMPPYHAYSIVCGLLAPLVYGAEINYGPIDNDNLIKRYKFVKPSVLITVPSVMKSALRISDNNLQSPEPSPLKLGIIGGSQIDQKLVSASKKSKIPLLHGYGLTECTSVVGCELIEDGEVKPLDDSWNSCFCHSKIKNGEIEVLGNVVAKGYFCGKQFYGKYTTGDSAHFEESHLHIDGRSDGAIVLENGNKIFPEQIEQKLSRFESIREVQVFANRKNGSITLGAQIAPTDRANMDSVKQDVEIYNASVPSYEQIMLICYQDIESFPRASLGKIKRMTDSKAKQGEPQ